ncbi:MAG: phosphatase PAP2 family protein, partial [Bacteroidales bacterium]
VMLGIKYKRSLLLIIPIIILTVTASDQLSVHAFKEVFQRLRPCHEPELSGLVHTVNNKCGGLYGFVSSHAANSFAVAVLSLGLLRKKWFTAGILFWAALVSYSRVYLGVHYPGDIIGGALLGTLIAYAFLLLYGFLEGRIMRNSDLSRTENMSDADN